MQLHIANATINITIPSDYDAQVTILPPALSATEQPRGQSLLPPAMGDYWPGQGGRYICSLPALLGLPARHLIAGEGEAEDLTFGPRDDVPAATSQIDGAANTAALLATGKDHPAAQWSRAYTADGHADFFLPSKLDMVMAHICAPQLFKKSGWYWTSTQGSRYDAFVQAFEDGTSDWNFKDNERRVRAFRVIPLDSLTT